MSSHTNTHRRWLTCLLLITISAGCTPDTGNGRDGMQRDYWVNSFKVPCEGVAPMSCLQVHDGESPYGEWRNFHAGIEGFDYRPGSLYRIRVRETRLPPEQVPADASSIRYELVEILEQRPDERMAINDIWVLDSVAGTAVDSFDPASVRESPYIEFNVASSEYLGFDGCNRFRGRIDAVTESVFEPGPAAGTKMACGDGELQSTFGSALASVAAYERDGLLLRLLDDGGNAVLVFRKVD